MFIIVIYFWRIDTSNIIKCPLFLFIFGFKVYFVWNSYTQSNFFCFLFSENTYSFTCNPSASLNLKCVSCSCIFMSHLKILFLMDLIHSHVTLLLIESVYTCHFIFCFPSPVFFVPLVLLYCSFLHCLLLQHFNIFNGFFTV